MDKIVLLSKQPGVTSFTSLYNVKRAFNTTKVGHTGTLDNFAQGLLVVCTGRLTRLAGNITEFDKSYKAVIKFGSETDTLDYEGNIIRNAELPDEKTVREVINSFIGEQKQTPTRRRWGNYRSQRQDLLSISLYRGPGKLPPHR